MGASFSSTGGTGRNVRISDWSSSKCARIPQYADRRVWVLKNLYKVKDINEFPLKFIPLRMPRLIFLIVSLAFGCVILTR